MSLLKFQPWMVRERFIETGTYLGDTLATAAEQPFKYLDSCEVLESFCKHARHRFAHDPRIEVFLGSSPAFLRAVLRDVPTTFWLDAHFSGKPHPRDPRHPECPLLEELDLILAVKWTTQPIIIIDDTHMFEEAFWVSPDAWRFDRAQWPTLKEITDRLAGYELEMRDHKIFAR